MDMNLNLFDLLGIEIPEEKKVEKKAKDKKKHRKPSVKSDKAKGEKTFPLPATILLPYAVPQEIKADNGDKISEAELNKRYGTFLGWKSIEKEGANVIIGQFKKSCFLSKGVIAGNLPVKVGETELPNDTDGSVSSLSSLMIANYELLENFNFCFYKTDTCIIPAILGCTENETDSDDDIPGVPVFASTLFIPGVGSYELTDDTEAEELLDRMFMGQSSEFDLYNDHKGVITAVLGFASEKTKADSSASSKDVFDISSGDVSLSLVWKKYTLSPELFSGKEKITKKELCHFLLSEGFPEYSEERTMFEYPDKQNKKLLIAILKGSSKGAMPFVEWSERESKKSDEYSLFFSKCNGRTFRCEYTPFANFEIPTSPCEGMGSFELKLPKIPIGMLHSAFKFFYDIYNNYGTESALQLFWDNKDKKYFWYVPEQYLGAASVHFLRDATLEYNNWLIADFHSHGRFGAFFSDRDNLDEKGTRIYGVVGSLAQKNSKLLLRAGSGGFFLDIDSEDIFDFISTTSLENLLISDRIHIMSE